MTIQRTMIGRVGRPRSSQLRGELHTLRLKLREAEARTPPNGGEIRAIRAAIENTERKLEEMGYS